MSDAPGDAPARSTRRLALLSVSVSIAGTLLAVEIALRLAAGSLGALPDPGGAIRMVGTRYPGSHDPELGFVPTPGPAPENVWGTTVTITPAGVRSNGEVPAPDAPLVLAVGDSFTFGDQVDDSDTWPAQLERLFGRPVVNGGVFGYGFDQIVLRSERLLERFDAETLVVSLIPDDVLRCEYAYRYAWKPYFEIVDGALALRNVPVPAPHQGRPEEAAWRRALRWSQLGHFVMSRLDPDDWSLPDSLRVHRRGVAVARLLVDRLADVAEQRGHRLLLVLQWHPAWDGAPAAPVLERAAARGVETLQLESLLRDAVARGPGGVTALYRIHRRDGREVSIGHMTPRGNALVARAIAERLAQDAVARRPGRRAEPPSGLAPGS